MEKAHSEEFDKLVPVINGFVRDFLKNYGIKFINIPAKNIIIIDRSKLTPQQLEVWGKRYDKVPGTYIPESQFIMMLADYTEGGKMAFLQTLIHEMMHVNAFLSFQENLQKNKGYKLTQTTENGKKEDTYLLLRRMGFRIRVSGGSQYFHDLDESIMTELAMRFDQKYFSQLPELAEEYRLRQKVIREISHQSGETTEITRQKVARIKELNQGEVFTRVIPTKKNAKISIS